MNLRAMERAFDLRDYLEDKGGKRYGGNFATDCPICSEDGHSEKLYVLLEDTSDGKKAGAWVDYYCGDGGSSVSSLIQRLENCNLARAIEILVENTREDVKKQTSNGFRDLVQTTLFGIAEDEEWAEAPTVAVELPKEFIPYDGTKPLPPYFAERGINEVRAKKYGLGWCETGFYKNRLIVPVLAADGTPAFFMARYMAKVPPTVTCKRCMGKGSVAGATCKECKGDGRVRGKKSLYPKGCSPNRVLFNYDRARRQKRIVLIEDVFSTMQLAGGPEIQGGAMGTFGTTLSQYQLDLLLRTDATEIVLLWDRDATVRHDGRTSRCSPRCADCDRYEKTWALASRLTEFWSVRVPQLPDARDPDEHKRRDTAALIESTPPLKVGSSLRSMVTARLS